MSETNPCIVVAGMGRCGTSLMMQMLSAAGVPCDGEWPAFEVDTMMEAGFDADAFSRRRGHAVKMIDPARLAPGAMPHHVVIWMQRDFGEQARSQIKFAAVVGGYGASGSRQEWRGMKALLRQQDRGHKAALGIPARTPSIMVDFEGTLRDPRSSAGKVTAFLAEHGWGVLDVESMVRQVRFRTAKCYRGFLEAELLAAGKPT